MSRICSLEGCEKIHYGKGLCKYHYMRLRKTGSIDLIKVKNLPGEEWRPSKHYKLEGIWFSNLGRVKSCRKKDERLLKLALVQPLNHKSKVLLVRPGDSEVRVAQEMLRIFVGNPEGDSTVIYRDNDPENVKIENLAWYGRGYLVEKAIIMAQISNHPLADCFIKFWMGEHQVINNWLISISDLIRGYVYNRLQRVGFPYYIEIDDLVQQALYDIFIALYRGMFKSFDFINQWVISIARAAYLRFIRLRGSLSTEYEMSDGRIGFIADLVNFCNPSVELQAIYNEEIKLEI